MSSPLAPYACDPAQSRGRLHREPESELRSPFQRDRDRILHSGAFRRLKHKTQVFVEHEGDYYRTRLTHSLEVAQIARTIARVLRLDEDLAEAVALAHDLGHAPFGHAGEDVLDEVMAAYGGFDHNVQALRILTRLERRYADFDGLNLTWETLEGVAKHNGPVTGGRAGPDKARIAAALAGYDATYRLDLGTWPSAEAQVAALSDEIAYHSHDLDDGLRAGLFGEEDLASLPLVGEILAEVRSRHPGLERSRLIHETVRRLMNAMIRDVIAETRRRLDAHAVASAAAIRALDDAAVAFSQEMAAHNSALKAFLFARMYRHHRVNRMTSKARRIVRELYGIFSNEPNTLPDEWRTLADGAGTPRTARVVTDYIAGMTDRYALDEHRRLFDPHSKP